MGCKWYLGYIDDNCVRAAIQERGPVINDPSRMLGHCPYFKKRKRTGTRSKGCRSCWYFSGRIDELCLAPKNPKYAFKASSLGWGCPNYISKTFIGQIKRFMRDHRKVLSNLTIAICATLFVSFLLWLFSVFRAWLHI